MRSRDPVAIWDRFKYRTIGSLRSRYWSCDRGDHIHSKWLLYNMDRDHWVLRDDRIFFTDELYMMTFLKQFPKLYFTAASPRKTPL